MTTTYAIIHIESGMLMGLGDSESSAWADAERSAREGRVPLPRDEHACRQASHGMHWEERFGGGIGWAEEVTDA